MLLVLFLTFSAASSTSAQEMQNPYWDESNSDFKLWHDDPSPMPPLKSNRKNPIALPEVSKRLQPVDPSEAEASDGMYVKYMPYTSVDPLERVYAGFSFDFFGGADGGHANLREPWGAAGPNFVDGIKRGMIEEVMGDMAAISDSIRKRYGINWANASVANAGPGSTLDPNTADEYDRFFYFNNTIFTTPTSGSGPFTAMMPNYLMLDGASYDPQYAFMRLIVTAGYMPIETRRELLRNGLFAPAVQAAWRQALPYKADPNHPLRHRSHYKAQGDDNGGWWRVHGLEDSFAQHQTITHNYDPNLHSENLVEHFQSMRVAPPVALLELLENTGSVDNNSARSSLRLWHLAGQTATARVRVEGIDIQGLPLDYQWTVVRGNKNATIEHVEGDEWLITVPYDSDLPGGLPSPNGRTQSHQSGRTDIILTASNGHQTSAPAVISFFLWDSSLDDWRYVWDPYVPEGTYHPTRDNYDRVTPPSGIVDATILPGETLQYDLYSEDPNHFPLSYTQWEGAGGELDGNIWTFTPTPDEVGTHNLAVTAHTESFEDTTAGSQAVVEVRETIAEPAADVLRGPAPLTVEFDGSASRDAAGAITDYSWDFDDGSSPATGVAPSHTFTEPGIYQVALTVSGPSGSHTGTLMIEVQADWELLIDNGWDGDGLDPASWTTDETDFNIDHHTAWFKGNRLDYPEINFSNGEIRSTEPLEPPFLVDVEFSYWEARDTYVNILGHRFGTGLRHSAEGIRETLDFAFTNGEGGDSIDIAAHSAKHARPTTTRLRVYVMDDPENPGRLKIRGFAGTSSGTHPIAFDNLAADLDDYLRLQTPESGMTLNRVRAWTSAAPGLGKPTLMVLGPDGVEMDHRYFSNSTHHIRQLLLPPNRDFGLFPASGEPLEKTYTLVNGGSADLDLGSTPVRLKGDSAFTVVAQPTATSLQPGESDTFTIRYTPVTSRGQEVARVFVSASDPALAHHRFWVKGRARTPSDILVRGNHSNIAAGATTARNQDFTDFGPATVGESVTHRFFLFNNGHDPLTLGDIALTGSGDFALTRPPRDVIGANGSTFFEVTFTPGATGAHNATVTVTSDDADTPSYSFALAGEGLPDPGPPAVEVRGNDVLISDEDTTPDSADHTDFGSTAVWDRGQILRTFHIGSTGGDLDITGVTLSGPNADRFAVIGQPPAFAKADTSVPFHVLFDPEAAGVHSATVTVATSDPSNPEIVFDIRGEGLAEGVLAVEGGGDAINNGSTRAYRYDNTYFGFYSIGDSTTRTFYINNEGDLASLTGVSVSLSGPHADQFSVTTQPSSTIGSGSRSSFSIEFNPDSGGTKDAIVTVSADGVDDFTFAIRGSSQFLEQATGFQLPQAQGGTFDMGDYDNDGDQDMVITGTVWVNDGWVDSSYIFRNDNGIFNDIGASTLPQDDGNAVAWGDFDGDGDLDVAFALNTSLDFYRNDEGTFVRTQQLSEEGYYPKAIRFTDFDGDGDLDMVTSIFIEDIDYWNTPEEDLEPDQEPNDRGAFMLVENIDGTFQYTGSELPGSYVLGSGFKNRIASADVDRNGWPDYLSVGTSLQTGDPVGFLLLNHGPGMAFEAIDLSPSAEGLSTFIDYNLDGFLDVVIASYKSGGSIIALINDGTSRNFTETDASPGGDDRQIVAADWADYNADGTVDMVASLNETVGGDDESKLYRHNSGQFEEDESLNVDYFSRGAYRWTDLEFDGGLDLIVMGRGAQNGADDGTYVFQNIDVTSRSTAADVPSNLMVEDNGDGTVLLSWATAFDQETPTAAMTYNVRIGSAPGQDDVRPAQADLVTGQRRLSASGDFLGGVLDPDSGEFVGNIARFNLPPGDYYAAVQGIDGAFVGGPWSEEVAFTVIESVGGIIDEDGDGLDDEWEIELYGDINLYGPSDDPNNDGVSLMMDYAMDFPDTRDLPKPIAMVPDATTDDEWLELRQRRSTTAPNVTWTLWQSTDLSDEPGSWQPVFPDGVDIIQDIVEPDPDGDGSAEVVRIRIRHDDNAASLFFQWTATAADD